MYIPLNYIVIIHAYLSLSVMTGERELGNILVRRSWRVHKTITGIGDSWLTYRSYKNLDFIKGTSSI